MQWKFIQHTINFQSSNFLSPEDSMERQIDHIEEIVYELATGVLVTPKKKMEKVFFLYIFQCVFTRGYFE